jgi:hypothetical protein
MFILEEELQRRKFKNFCLDELRVLVTYEAHNQQAPRIFC